MIKGKCLSCNNKLYSTYVNATERGYTKLESFYYCKTCDKIISVGEIKNYHLNERIKGLKAQLEIIKDDDLKSHVTNLIEVLECV
jgi:hypothetical protein